MRKGVTLVIFSLFSLVLTSATFACVGARPLSMGGAFVAVADDVNAVYWNPAGLTQLQENQTTWMHTYNNRDLINYQDFLGYAMPSQKKGVSVGIGYIHSTTIIYIPPQWEEFDQKWYTVSLAKKINENMSLGINLKQYREEITLLGESIKDDAIGIDVGYLYKMDEKVSIGLLVQDINKPKTFKEELGGIEYLRNIRPGIAYKPNEETTIAMDIYYFTLKDATDPNAKGQSDVRMGIEWIANENLALRAGFYGDAFKTMGIGYKKGNFQIDYALLTGDDTGTHLVSGTIRFSK